MNSAKTVLVPLDGSAHATAAMPVARALAELLHATVAVLHVTDDALAAAALVERMKLSCEDVRGLVIERHPGVAADVIVQEAARRHAAMIVMCPQVRTDLRSRALGRVAEAVLGAALCPVVLVPPVRGRKHWYCDGCLSRTTGRRRAPRRSVPRLASHQWQPPNS